METRRSPRFVRVFAAAVVAACIAPSASAQVPERASRTFVVPPPSAASTGGEPTTPLSPLQGAPRLRGFKLETRDAMHPDEIVLVGLEQSEKPYRPDLGFKRSALGGVAKPVDEDSELYRRQLSIYSGEAVEDPPDETPDLRGAAADGSGKADAGELPEPWFHAWHAAAFALACAAFVWAWRRWTKPR